MKNSAPKCIFCCSKVLQNGNFSAPKIAPNQQMSVASLRMRNIERKKGRKRRQATNRDSETRIENKEKKERNKQRHKRQKKRGERKK